MLLSSTTTFSQNLFIQPSLEALDDLSISELERLAQIQAQDMYSELSLIQLGSLIEVQDGGKIIVNFPNDDCQNLVYKAKRVDYENEDSYSWYGVLESTADPEDCLCRTGAITIEASEFGKIAHIMVDDKTFEVLQLSPDRFALGKLDVSKFDESECGVTDATPVGYTDPNYNTQDRSNSNCNVRCLVLYTPNAEIVEGDVAAINTRVNLAIAQTNQALRNSNVNGCQLTVQLAGVEPFDFSESTNIKSDVGMIATDITAMTLRDNFEADIVLTLTGGASYGTTRGIVDAIGPIEEQAFAIVQTGAATTGRFTFAHEVSHLFGGRHNTDSDSGSAHAHRFKTGNFLPCIFGSSQRTILYSLATGQSRIQHYSNPNVKVDGKKTGTTNRNNAQQMINTACTVAGFRETLESFNVAINGDTNTCPCEFVILNTTIFGGTAGNTYSYDWFESDDGINWTPLPFTGPNAHVTAPCTPTEGIHIRVEVTGSDGNFATSQTYIEATIILPEQGTTPCGPESNPFTNNDDSRLDIYPNPAQSQVTIQFQPKISGTYSLSIRDINGKVVETILENEYLESGIYKYIPALTQKGIYFIHSIDESGNNQIQKLLKF